MSNIQVLVRTNYVEAQSIPLEHRYVYTYTITIANKSDVPAQLISRHWRITDANEKLQEVQGMGVVGESYTYTSGVILETETGIMEGTYHMRTDEGAMFDAPIPTFALVPPHAVH
jgi:ApaG protein